MTKYWTTVEGFKEDGEGVELRVFCTTWQSRLRLGAKLPWGDVLGTGASRGLEFNI